MVRLLRNRWFLLGVGYVLVAVLAAVGAMAATVALQEEVIVSDRIAIAHSMAVEKPQSLPLTVEAAESVEWRLATWCIMGKGRFFRKGKGDEPV